MSLKQDLIEQVKKEYQTEAHFPWKKHPDYAVFKHASNKWFALFLSVPKEKLGLDGTDFVDILNIKCRVEMVGSLRLNEDIFPAYHMNKEHWISIRLDGAIGKVEILDLIHESYELTSR